MLDNLAQISRTVSDIEAATHWYRDVLGLTHLFSAGELAFFDMSGTRLALSQASPPQSTESILYFQVSDIDAVTASLKDHQVEILREAQFVHRHEDGTEEWMAFFNDPDGRPLALLEQRKEK
ncbi:MAG: VOC family protein [Pseudomonadota bacterium]